MKGRRIGKPHLVGELLDRAPFILQELACPCSKHAVLDLAMVGVDGELLKQCGVGCDEPSGESAPGLDELSNGCLCPKGFCERARQEHAARCPGRRSALTVTSLSPPVSAHFRARLSW
jgi:hypothetical protein